MLFPHFRLSNAALTSAVLLLTHGPALANTPATQGGVPAMYATQAEAEQAAKAHFNCTGAHRMGNQWMPCSTHGTPPANGHSH